MLSFATLLSTFFIFWQGLINSNKITKFLESKLYQQIITEVVDFDITFE